MSNVSSGFLNELAYVSLAYGLIHTALEIESGKCDDCGATKRSNSNYHINKQINRRMAKLKDELWQFLEQYKEHAKKVMIKNRRLFTLVLSHVKDSIQLDYLAVNVLSLRFAPNERKKQLDDAFKWIIDKEGQLLAIMDLLSETDAGKKESEMFYLADIIVRDL